MHGALPRLRLSHKKTTYASEQDIYRIARQRHEFRHGRWRVDPRKWVIVDDPGINLGMALEQCEENGSGASSPNIGEKVSLLGAVNGDLTGAN